MLMLRNKKIRLMQHNPTLPMPASLQEAIEQNNETAVQVLMSNGTQPDVRLENGQTPMQYAAALGAEDCVRVLLQSGATPDLSYTGLKPLGAASVQGHAKCVALLLNGGASLQPISIGNALIMAARAGHADCVRELLVYSCPAEYLFSALKAAISHNYTACAEMLATECMMLLDDNIDIETAIKSWLADCELLEFALQPDILALLSAPHRPVTVMQAVYFNDMQALKTMLDAGAPLCMCRLDYVCPSSLYHAIEVAKNYEAADMLIAAGADIHSIGLLDSDDDEYA